MTLRPYEIRLLREEPHARTHTPLISGRLSFAQPIDSLIITAPSKPICDAFVDRVCTNAGGTVTRRLALHIILLSWLWASILDRGKNENFPFSSHFPFSLRQFFILILAHFVDKTPQLSPACINGGYGIMYTYPKCIDCTVNKLLLSRVIQFEWCSNSSNLFGWW